MIKTAKTLSEYYGIDKSVFEKLDILDAFLDIDSRFFLDPLLLKNCKISEFKNSRKKIEEYFELVIRLLKHPESRMAMFQVKKLLLFKELKGVAIGHGTSSSDGSGIGPKLRDKLLNRSLELVRLGVEDPALFEMIGFFEEDFGPDRLSDMAISIIRHDLFQFTERVTKELNIKRVIKYKTLEKNYTLPIHPNGHKAIIFIPKSLLADLPTAESWEDISNIAWFNASLRARLNELLNNVWRKLNKKQQQQSLKNLLISDKNSTTSFLSDYRNYNPKPYDFIRDPKGEVLWLQYAREITKNYPIYLTLPNRPTITDVQNVIIQIILQFKKHVEHHGWNELLYEKRRFTLLRKKERNSQLLFYGVADSYCEANDLDLSREANAGTGSVDFKISRGYKLKHVVELKLSSNPNLVSGYTTQLPTYEESEGSQGSSYVIIKVTNTKTALDNIEEVLRIEKELAKNNKPHPSVYVIDGIIKPTASKRKQGA